jgi:hypothetical protein
MGEEKLTEDQEYDKIVNAVKAEAATMTGDECMWEIQRRWAKAKGRPFKKPRPPKLGQHRVEVPEMLEAPVEARPKFLPPSLDKDDADDATVGRKGMSRR